MEEQGELVSIKKRMKKCRTVETVWKYKTKVEVEESEGEASNGGRMGYRWLASKQYVSYS